MKPNPLTFKDQYKTDHRRQYPKGTQFVYSNLTPRSNRYAVKLEGVDDKIAFFGLQYFIRWFLIDTFNDHFFSLPKAQAVGRYKRRLDTSLGKDSVPVDHIEALHDLGYLPISIKALPEGACVNEKVPVLTIVNTLPQFFWLTNFLETVLSNTLWMPSTSATTSRKFRQLFTKYARLTGADEGFVPFQGHDFSARGQSSPQSAAMSGAAHLLPFVGSDTIHAIDLLEDYYGANAETELIGCSVPATEHSVMTMSGPDGELETFRRLITELYPSGIVSIVSDSFDFWQVITEFLPKLKPDIMARKGGPVGDKVVIRPDSGDPVKVVCGDPDAPVGSPQFKGAIECMWDVFGGTTTDKGFKVLDSHCGLIYGDGIDLNRCDGMLKGLMAKGFASTNIVLGIGSFAFQRVTRDQHGWAVKATAGIIDGELREIFKDPKTDDGLKKSARGLLRVDKAGEDYVLTDRVTREQEQGGELREVFRDGKLLYETTLAEIRGRINAGL